MTAKLFWSGRSQAVRLPKELRIEGTEVRISKRGNCVILEPMEGEWDWLDRIPPVDETFVAAVNEPVAEPGDRTEVDRFFA